MPDERPISDVGASILAGLQDALAYAQGETARGDAHTVQMPAPVDVKALRKRLGLTQRAIRNWERGRQHPEGPARLLLLVIDREPEAVHRALAS